MSKPFKVPDVLPEWFLLMNNNGYLTGEEVAKLFSFNSARSINKESFPLPDNRIPVTRMEFNKHIFKRHRPQWKKTTILKEIERRLEHNKSFEK